MAAFGRPGSSTDVDDIVEPRTLSSAEIQLLREEYLRLHGRDGAPNSVHHEGTANPGADVPGGSNPETTAKNPAENGGVKEAAKTTAPAAPKK